jgi:hypothetical protein
MARARRRRIRLRTAAIFVYALAASGNDLYVGDRFASACQPAASIARWNSAMQAWSTLGSGMTRVLATASVRAISVHDGIVYAGGDFDHTGGVAANHVAARDGNGWSQPGAGFDGDVHAPSSRRLTCGRARRGMRAR